MVSQRLLHDFDDRYVLLLLVEQGGLVPLDELFDGLAEEAQRLHFIKSILERVIQAVGAGEVVFTLSCRAVERGVL